MQKCLLKNRQGERLSAVYDIGMVKKCQDILPRDFFTRIGVR